MKASFSFFMNYLRVKMFGRNCGFPVERKKTSCTLVGIHPKYDVWKGHRKCVRCIGRSVLRENFFEISLTCYSSKAISELETQAELVRILCPVDEVARVVLTSGLCRPVSLLFSAGVDSSPTPWQRPVHSRQVSSVKSAADRFQLLQFLEGFCSHFNTVSFGLRENRSPINLPW